MAAITVEGLVVRYGDVVAVDGLDFSAEAGAVTVMLGVNGAGKTSTIEVLEGYRAPDAGSVRVLGLDPVRDHRALVARMGVMLQRGGINPGLRAREAARLFCAYYGDRRDPDELLARVGLTHCARRTWRQLSGGEQQRLSLALALAGDPDVVFLDEPTSGVDVEGRRVVRSVIRSLADAGACVLLTTHELAEAERVADAVVVVHGGRRVAAGSPEELRRGTVDDVRFRAPARLDVGALGAALGAPVVEDEPGSYRVDAPSSPALVAALTAWLAERDLPLGDLRAGRKSLEDVFVHLTSPGSARGGWPE